MLSYIWRLSYHLFPSNVCPSFCSSPPFSDVSASCFSSSVDWKVCPVGYTLSKSSMMYYAWLKWLSLICTIALLIYSLLIYTTFVGNPPSDLHFTFILRRFIPLFFFSLPSSLSHFSSICLHSSISFLLPPSPSHCSVFLLLLHSPPVPPSLQTYLLASEQLINLPWKARKPSRYRFKGKGT